MTESSAPGASVTKSVVATGGSFRRTARLSAFSSAVPSGSVSATVRTSSPTLAPAIGTSTSLRSPAASSIWRLAKAGSTSDRVPSMDTESVHRAGVSVDRGEVERQPRLVARREEVRQARRHHDRIADEHVLLARGRRRPWSRRAPSAGRVPLKSGIGTETCAVPSGPTSTMPEWKATSVSVGGGPSKRGEPGVAAGAHHAAHALHAVDQLVVEVADRDAEAALAEIVGSPGRASRSA